jgi:predicted ABC-type ATPase
MKFGLLVCGPSGVGKTSNIERMVEHAGLSNFSIVDPDKIQLSTQEERSIRAFEMVKEHIHAGTSFAYSGSCLRKRRTGELLDTMKSAGYKTVGCIVYTGVDTAIRRIRERIHQPVSEDIILDFHRQFKTRAADLMADKRFDEIYLFNNEKEFSLLLSKKKKSIVCRDTDSDFYFDISKYC